MVVDYRHVKMIATNPCMEHIPDLIHKMGHAELISVFDAKSGYWQTPVNPSQKWINSFITPEG
jgi:hypothetical protein